MDFLFPTMGPDLSWTLMLIVVGIVYYIIIEPLRRNRKDK